MSMHISDKMVYAFRRWAKREGFVGGDPPVFDMTYRGHLWQAFQAGVRFAKPKRRKVKRS